MSESKKCSRCEQLLPLDSFAFMSKETGKRQGYCRKCFSDAYRAQRQSGQWKPPVNRSRARTPEQKARRVQKTIEHRRKNAERYRAYAKEYRARNIEKFRAGERDRNRKGRKRSPKRYDPVKGRARSVLNNALRKGEVGKLPCAICGAEKSQAHHDDYSKPLDVKWLCVEHHIALHKGLLPG